MEYLESFWTMWWTNLLHVSYASNDTVKETCSKINFTGFFTPLQFLGGGGGGEGVYYPFPPPPPPEIHLKDHSSSRA